MGERRRFRGSNERERRERDRKGWNVSSLSPKAKEELQSICLLNTPFYFAIWDGIFISDSCNINKREGDKVS